MKKLATILAICFFLTIGGTVGCATMQTHKIEVTQAENGDFSFEGMVNPQTVMDTWTALADKTIQVGIGWLELYYLNPDKDSRISVVAILMYVNGYTRAYSYIYDGELYCFIRDSENCFKLYEWATQPDIKEQLKQRILKVMNGATV